MAQRLTPQTVGQPVKVKTGAPHPWIFRGEFDRIVSEAIAARDFLHQTLVYFQTEAEKAAGRQRTSTDGSEDQPPDLNRVNELRRKFDLNFCGAPAEIIDALFRTESGIALLERLVGEMDSKIEAVIEFDHFQN